MHGSPRVMQAVCGETTHENCFDQILERFDAAFVQIFESESFDAALGQILESFDAAFGQILESESFDTALGQILESESFDAAAFGQILESFDADLLSKALSGLSLGRD